MRLSHPSLTVSFFRTTTETVTVTEYEIVKNSFSFNEQLLNGLEPSSNRVSLKIKRDSAVIPKILSYQVDAKAVLSDGNTVLFTGYLSDNYTWKVNTDGEQELQVTIEDVGTKLLGKAYLTSDAPSLYNLRGKVFLRSTEQTSIVRLICTRAGITVSSTQPWLSDNPLDPTYQIDTEICANIDKNKTCKELLGGILQECGYTYYFNSDGELVLYRIDCTSVTGIDVIDKDSLWVVNGNAITLNKKVRQYKQINVSFDEYEFDRTAVLVYKDITGQDPDNGYPDCKIDVKPHAYYPVNLTEVTTIQDMQNLGTGDIDLGDYVLVSSLDETYMSVELGTPGADVHGVSYDFVLSSINEVSFVEAEDISKGREIIAITPNSVIGTCTHTGNMTYSITQRGAKNIAVVIQNEDNTTNTITNLQATATVTDVKAKCIIVAGESASSEESDNVYSTETTYIHKQADVQYYANLLASYYKYCNYTYTFYTKQDRTLGTLVHVEDNAFSGLEVDLLLIGRTYNDSTSMYQYTGVAISPFSLTADVESESTLVPDKVGLPGVPGPMGEGVLDIEYLYATSSDQTIEPSSSSYGPDIPDLDDQNNRVLWVKTILIYTDHSTSETVSIGAIYGNPGAAGETGTTVTMEYALTYSGVEPTSDDWSEERDPNWFVGYSYWKRFKFTDGEGNITYSEASIDENMNDIMASLASFSISSSTMTYDRDLRSADQVSIELTSDFRKYASPTFLWTIVGNSTQTYTSSSVSLSFMKKDAPAMISVQCTLTSLVNSVPYTATRNLLIMAMDKTEYNRNYGILESDPTGNFVYGDSYVKKSGVNYYPYVYTDSWNEITNVVYWPTQIAQVRDVILANGVDIPETSVAIYAYFKILSAQQAQIDTLSSTEIILQEGGVIKSQNYNQDTEGNPISGFKIDYEGNSAFVKSNVVDSIVSGSFTSNPLETQDRTEGSQITASWNSTAYYNDGDVFDNILTNAGSNQLTAVSGSYGSRSIEYVLAQNEAQRTEAKTLAVNNNVTQTTSISGTLGLNCSNVRITGTPLTKTMNTVAYTGSNVARMQFSLDGSTWNDFDGERIVSRNNGQSVYARQVYTPMSIDYINPTSWTNGGGINATAIAYGNGYFVAVGSANGTNTDGLVWKSTDGLSWTQTYNKGEGSFTDITFGNGRFVATASNGGTTTAILTSDDGVTWTTRKTDSGLLILSYVCYGGGKFKTATNSGWYTHNQSFESTDGITWTQNGNAAGRITYGNGKFVCMEPRNINWTGGGDGNVRGHISYCNGFFVKVTDNGPSLPNWYISTSTDGTTWNQVYSGVSTTTPVYSNVIFADNYYIMSFNSKTYYSTDLIHWNEGLSNGQSTIWNRSLIYQPGVGVVCVLPSVSYRSSESTYIEDDWTVATVGKLQITYDYTYYPTGATLMDSNKARIATISPNHNEWRTEKTVISAYSLNPTPYYTFNQFTQNGSALPSFDAREYNTGSSFHIQFTTYDGTSLNLTSSKVTISGRDYYYNVKWNGATMQIYLDGQSVGSFDSTDYFTSTHDFDISPVGTQDAILVKSVLPKADKGGSDYWSIGDEGREFSAGYFDNIYGIHHGDVIGDVTGDVVGNVTGNVTGNADTATSATTAANCTGNSATATRAVTAGDGTLLVKAGHHDEVNFGGTGNSTAIYIGYSSEDGRPIPTDYYFGTGATAQIHAAKVWGAVWN